MSTLERRYRRLLALYPAAHRDAHGQEMLDVLLSAAAPGQTRPSPADTADLLLGAARIRHRRAVSRTGTSTWPDALSITGFLALLLLAAEGVRFAANGPRTASIAAGRSAAAGSGALPHDLPVYLGTGAYWLLWTAIAVLAWRGLRRRAAATASAVTAAQLAIAVYGTTFQPLPYTGVAAGFAGTSLPLALLATASLLASPGPRHGARLLGGARVAGAVLTAAVLTALLSFRVFALVHGDGPADLTLQGVDRFLSAVQAWNEIQLAGVLAAVVLATAALAHDRATRRAFALLAIVGGPALVRAFAPVMDAGDPSAVVVLPRLLAFGALAFGLTMFCVRLLEMPLRTHDVERASA